jgi:hypothetical protein
MSTESIIKEIVSSCGSSESSRVYLIADIRSGETELVIEKTISERYPITDYEKVMDLHKQITGGGGRRLMKIKDFAKR